MSLKLNLKAQHLIDQVEKFLHLPQHSTPQPKPASRPRPPDADAFDRAVPRPGTQTNGTIPAQYPLMQRPAPSFDPDKATRIVDGLYQGVLGRAPDESGMNAYRPLVEQGRLSVVVNALVQSDEFRQRAQTIDETALGTSLYTGILGRPPDPEGLTGTVGAIHAGITAARAFDMVLSPENTERLDAPPPPELPKRTGRVRAEGSSFADDGGKFNGLGATMMWAAWAYKYDRPKLEAQLEQLAKNGFNYVRALGVVGDPKGADFWDGREIDWRDPDYQETIAGLTDLAYDKYGLRVQWTMIGDGQKNIPNEADRFRLADSFLEMSKGREDKIMMFEIANEAWQNGFEGEVGAEQLRKLTKYVNDRTDILTASSAPPGGDEEAIKSFYEGGVADVGTFHFDRDIHKAEGAWRPVRQPWEYRYSNVLPTLGSNNEPIGPGSSVNGENDPKKLVTAALVSYVANVGSYVWHTRAGVRGDLPFEDMAGLDAFAAMQKYVPPDLSSWTPKNGHWADSPVKPYIKLPNGQLEADSMWPDEPGATGAVRVYSAVKGNEFFTVPFGIKGGLVLEPRRNMEFDVINPMTGDVIDHQRLDAGQRFELSGDEVFVLKGRYV